MLRHVFHSWDRSIFRADAADRRPQAFGWGLGHLDDLGIDWHRDGLPEAGEALCGRSDEFFRAGEPARVEFDGVRLTFDSPLPAPDPEVGRASARFFASRRGGRCAIVLVPQWNADEGSLVGACRILSRFGFSVLRMTLPFHEERRPARMVRAEAMVSPVLGLTLQSVRRAVVEVRQAVRWLRDQGYERVGLFGTSLGSCVGFLALAHEDGIDAAAFNHVAGEFADVVWSGLATGHVRRSLEPHIDLKTLRRCWAPISPVHFAPRLRDRQPKLLLVSGAYDPIFLPEHSLALVDALRAAAVDFRRVTLPCGHYTLGRPPFYLIDAYLIIRFFRRYLA